MTWALFAVLQLALFTVAAVAAVLLRNRELKRRFAALEAASEAADETVQAAMQRYETLAADARDAWLRTRIEETADAADSAGAFQHLVFANELEPRPDFEQELQARLAAGSEASEHYRAQWQALREQSYAVATNLTESYPLSQAVIAQLYAVFEPLDQAFGVELPALPEAPERDPSDEADIAQEAEHLRAANELLHQQLEKAQNDLAGYKATGEEAEEQAEDLKRLLQQFTRDSRDMMSCIQNLERENARLREQLGESDPSADGDRSTHAA
ncbi:MAG: hypothetical protein R3E86_17530 [Pseudomonadales bacterium]